MKEPYQIKKEELSNVYKNNNFKQGLTSKEALEKLNADGPNTLEVKQTPKWKLFLRQFNNVVIYILLLSDTFYQTLYRCNRNYCGSGY